MFLPNKQHIRWIPSFRYRDNSVHLPDCSPFWVGIFITFNKETTMSTVLCRHAHFDWQNTEVFLYVIESHILCKHGNILVSLTLKENTISKSYTIYIYCRDTYPKGKPLMKIYRVVPQTKRGNCATRIHYCIRFARTYQYCYKCIGCHLRLNTHVLVGLWHSYIINVLSNIYTFKYGYKLLQHF